MGTYLPDTGTLGGDGVGRVRKRPGVVLGLLAPKIPLPDFYPPHLDVGPAYSVSAPLLPVWMDVVSLIP